MDSHKIREMMKNERKLAQRWFRRQQNQNYLATPGIHNCVVVLDHLKPTYNIEKIFRNTDAFGAKEIHLIKIDFFDPAPGIGAFKWVPAILHDTFSPCYTDLVKNGYVPFILEPDKRNTLTKTLLPIENTFIFEHEEFWINFEPDLFPGIQRMTIPQVGRYQNLNVSVVASIVLYECAR